MKNIVYILTITFLITVFTSCIGDDIIEDRVIENLSIIDEIDTIGIEESYQFEYRYLDNVGARQDVNVEWSSSDEGIISISNNGLAKGIEVGEATITVDYQGLDNYLTHTIEVAVGDSTTEVVTVEIVKEGKIVTTSSYTLQGDFTVQEIDGNLIVEIDSNYQASTALPGLFVYLSNNPNSVAAALEISAVTTFDGAHTYTISDVGLDDYKFLLYFCKPFNIKVGDGDYGE